MAKKRKEETPRIRQAERGLDLKELELRIQEEWRSKDLYRKLVSLTAQRPKYSFLDGPPYASGSIHLGTAWNKVLKDATIRYLTMRGYHVRRQAGWDCHGLPIEVKVEGKLGIQTKKEIEERGVETFVAECRRWAREHIETMGSQFQRLGVWMDWDHPYVTMDDEYIEAAWWTLQKAHEKGLLTQDYRVVTWCPRCETALAEAEIEYRERVDPSIYVAFPLEGRKGEYLLIWTTTPWTLVGNLAVMIHPEYEYVRAKTERGIFLLAAELAPLLQECCGLEYEILETLRGEELLGLRYRNPLSRRIALRPTGTKAYSVIPSEAVTLGEGTGCVHCAPGHGPEDFEAGQKAGIEPVCPVDERGVFTSEAGEFEGLQAKRDDSRILDRLTEEGALLFSETLSHRYGHCWRCRTPILYRATEQWFIQMTRLKDQMLEEIARVEWIPNWAGASRFQDWVENARDWTISRQRYWGIPLPVWICKSCRKWEVIGSKAELFERGGEEAERTFQPDLGLHKPYVDRVRWPCECGGVRERVPDVLDVWFDSGVAAWASLGYPAREEEFREWFPADFITEGHDQTRGWFYTQLGCGLLAFDRVPYKRVLMHGFTLDERGEKMSKSRGNVVTPEEVIERYSAEVLRFYTLWANKPWEDLRFHWEEVKVVQKFFTILWNVYVFATTYMSIDGFDPGKEKVRREHYRKEDLWILSRLHSSLREATEAYEGFQIYRAARGIQDFVIEDLSRWYVPLIRSRIWIEKEAPEKRAAYQTLYEVLTTLARVLAPIAPHITEEIYRNLTGRESVHFEAWIEARKEAIDPGLEAGMTVLRRFVESATAAREKRGIKRRWPVQRIVCHPYDASAAGALRSLRDLFLAQANALEIEVLDPGEEFPEKAWGVVPNPGTIGPDFREKSQRIIEHLKTLRGEELRGKERFTITIEGETYTLRSDHITLQEALPDRYVEEENEFGKVYVDTEATEETLSKGYAREFIRRIQEMRKEMDLDIEAYIQVSVTGSDEEALALLEGEKDHVSRETRATKLAISREREGSLSSGAYRKTWEIAGRSFSIAVDEVRP
jgi:isoleucyl-tRNA synthetase